MPGMKEEREREGNGWISIPGVLNFHRWPTQCGEINTEKSTNFEYQITRPGSSVVPPSSFSKRSKLASTSLLSRPSWKNMRPTLENSRWRFESCTTPLYTKRGARRGDTYKPANAQRLPLPPPQGHDPTDCLMHATIPPPPFHRTLSRRRWIFAYAVGGASNEFYEPAYRLHGLI